MPSAAGAWCSLLNLRGFNLIKINGPVHKEAGHKRREFGARNTERRNELAEKDEVIIKTDGLSSL